MSSITFVEIKTPKDLAKWKLFPQFIYSFLHQMSLQQMKIHHVGHPLSRHLFAFFFKQHICPLVLKRHISYTIKTNGKEVKILPKPVLCKTMGSHGSFVWWNWLSTSSNFPFSAYPTISAFQETCSWIVVVQP